MMRNPKYEMLHVIIQGKIEGKRGPGRRKTSWLQNLRQWYGVSTTTLFRSAVDKVKIMRLIAYALGGPLKKKKIISRKNNFKFIFYLPLIFLYEK